MKSQDNESVTFFGTTWLATHPWITFVLIFIYLVYVYNKVFRVRKLPILKDIVIYLMIAVGAYVLLIFQMLARLPIVYSLTVAVGLMLTVRIRYFFEKRTKKQQ